MGRTPPRVGRAENTTPPAGVTPHGGGGGGDRWLRRFGVAGLGGGDHCLRLRAVVVSV